VFDVARRRRYASRVSRRRRSRARRLRREGNTLLYVAGGFALIGTLLAVFIPAFVREVRLSKTAEAAEMLQTMHFGASAYFASRQSVDGVERRRCLPAHAGPTPARPYVEARAVDFFDDQVHDAPTWRVLSFRSERPIRFSYRFDPVRAGCDLRTPEHTYIVTYSAEGDLDGDGLHSRFERRDAASSDEDALVPVGILYERDRTE
jgi:hypothetical protein